MATATKTHPAPRRGKRKTRKAPEPERSLPANSEAPANPASPFIEPESRHGMISDAAYFLAERRDFCPGRELDDWLSAERDIDRLLDSAPDRAGCGA